MPDGGLGMIKKYMIAVAMLAVTAGAFASALYAGPTTEQLTSDIDAISENINEVQVELDRYNEGSLVWFQIDLRLKVLEATRQMLEQKRSSILRGIDLRFVQEGRELVPLDAGTLKALDEEIAAAEAAADAAQAKADRYSGGLLQGLALAAAASHRASAALIEQRRAILMLGYALPPQPKASAP